MTSLIGQEEHCTTTMEPAVNLNQGCISGLSSANLPIMEVQINIHFIGTAAGNFLPGDPNVANPAFDYFTVAFPSSFHTLQLEAISIAGNWKTEKTLPGESPAHVDCGHWPPGIYLVVIRQRGEIVHRQKVAVFPNR